MNSKFKLLFIACSIISHLGHAQVNDEYTIYGIKAGGVRSKINSLETMILSEPFFLNYTLKSREKYGYAAGIFWNYRFKNSKFSAQTEIFYAQQGSELNFNNLATDFNYKIKFKYQYVNLTTMVKFYPLAGDKNDFGLNVFFGPQVGFTVAPEAIVYTSGGSGRQQAFGSDLEQQQQLRSVLKGKTNFGLNFGLGYDFPRIPITIDARYYYGITDVVETQANSYNFIENHNRNTAILLTVGWHFEYKNE